MESHFAKGVVTSVMAKAQAKAAIYNNQLCSVKVKLSFLGADNVNAFLFGLLRAEDSVAGVAQTGYDIGSLVQQI